MSVLSTYGTEEFKERIRGVKEKVNTVLIKLDKYPEGSTILDNLLKELDNILE